MLKKLDRYIIGKFLGTFFFSIVIILTITIVFDISEKIDDFIEHQLTLKQVALDYYIYFIPYFTSLFSPLFIFVSVIFFTSKMASNTEIVAILSSGISFQRMLWPYFVACSVLTVMFLWLSNFVIPEANKGRVHFENTYINMSYKNYGRNQHFQIEPGTFIYFDSYSYERNVGYKFCMEKFDEDGQLNYKLISDHIRWDTTINQWTVRNYYIRLIDENRNERLVEGHKLDTTYAFYPSDFGQRLKTVETMNYFELNKYIEAQIMKGSDYIDYFLIEKYRRVSMPFATFILALIAVTISSRKVRGGIGMHLFFGAIVAFGYIMFMQVSQTFAIEGSLPAIIAVWIPNMLFAGVAAVLYSKAAK